MRVLLVDDVPEILHGYGRQIKHAEIRTAAGVAEARAVLEGGFVPDVVVSDYGMTDGTGLDVLREVKQRCPGARCYIATGRAAAELPAEVHELAVGVVRKGSTGLLELLKSLS
jgi:DNA-binding NtrC family response regulator